MPSIFLQDNFYFIFITIILQKIKNKNLIKYCKYNNLFKNVTESLHKYTKFS